MKYNYFKTLICFFVLMIFCSCVEKASNSEDLGNYFDIDFEALSERYVSLDTIPLSDSINYFNFDINIEHIKKNKITAAQFPNLSVYMLDSTGTPKKKITQAGDAPGMLGNARTALSVIDENENIFVLTTGNRYRLFMFDKNYNYIKSFNLFKLVDDVYVHPASNAIKLLNKNKDQLSLIISVGSTVYGSHSADFFENAMSLVEFTIDLSKLEVVDYVKHLPYKEIPEVKEALVDEQIWWNLNEAVFDFQEDSYYLVYPFSKHVTIYDTKFNFVDNINFEKLDALTYQKYSEPMGTLPLDVYDRTVSMRRLEFENFNINFIDIKGDYLLIQFPEILRENSNQLPTKEEIGRPGQVPPRHLNAIIKNLETGEEKFIVLPTDFYRIQIIDWNTFYGFHISNEEEFNALIKLRYE